MGGAGFRKWLQRVEQLTRRQREQLLDVLRPAVDLDRARAAIEGARSSLSCPHCGGQRLYRHGYDRGLQRYRCRACKKTFNALSGTPLARLRHRQHWLGYLDGMLDGTPVRAAAEAIGVHRKQPTVTAPCKKAGIAPASLDRWTIYR
jgi:transposase-like protein